MLRVYLIGVTMYSLKAASTLDFLPSEYQGRLFLSVIPDLLRDAGPALMARIPQELHTIVAGDFMKENRELRETLFAALLRGNDYFQRVWEESDIEGTLNIFLSESLSKCMYWRLPPYYRESYGIEVIPVDVEVTRSQVTAEEKSDWGLIKSGLYALRIDALRIESGYIDCKPLMGDFVRCSIGRLGGQIVIDLQNRCGLIFKKNFEYINFFPMFRAVLRLRRLENPVDEPIGSFTHEASLLVGETSQVSWFSNHLQIANFRESDLTTSPTLRALVYMGYPEDKNQGAYQGIYQIRDFHVGGNQLQIEPELKGLCHFSWINLSSFGKKILVDIF